MPNECPKKYRLGTGERYIGSPQADPPAKEKWPGHRLRNPNHPSGIARLFLLADHFRDHGCCCLQGKGNDLGWVHVHHLPQQLRFHGDGEKTPPPVDGMRRKARFQWIIPRFLVKMSSDNYKWFAATITNWRCFRGEGIADFRVGNPGGRRSRPEGDRSEKQRRRNAPPVLFLGFERKNRGGPII